MGLFDDIGKAASNSFSDVGNFLTKGTQAIGNFYGFDNSGKWTGKSGFGALIAGDAHMLDEGVGELTCRNQSRAAMNQARDQFNVAQTQAQDLITQQRWNSQQADILASNNAGAQTATNNSRSGINYSNSTPLGQGSGFNGGGGKDFLGL